jgi:thiol-disulfide isomerase/thioredoxin
MRALRLALIAAALVAGLANASPTAPRDGADFTTLAAPQPTQTVGKKIEVIEFFAYHCGACNAFEPTLKNWAKQQGDRIALRRMPLPFQGPADPEAHLFLTLEAMGKLDAYHGRVFDAVHVERRRLMKDADIIAWAGEAQTSEPGRRGLPGRWHADGHHRWHLCGVASTGAGCEQDPRCRRGDDGHRPGHGCAGDEGGRKPVRRAGPARLRCAPAVQ